MKYFLCNGKQQIVADGNPNLRKHCILTRSVERLDVQPLLYPFEETFHLPAFPVEFCYSQVRMSEIIGQESVDIACGIILINDHAESVWIPLGGFRADKSDDGVAYNSSLLVYRSFLHHFIPHVVLGSCYEERLLTMEVIEQLFEVDIALVHEIVASRLYRYQAHRLGVMNGSLSQIYEGRYGTMQIQQRMHLKTAFVMMQASPRTKLEAQLNRTAVKSIHNTIHVKSGRLVLIQFSCPGNQYLPEVMVYTPILGLIYMSQSRTLDILYSPRIEFGRECHQRCINAAEANLVGELGKTHHQELVSAFEPDGMSVAIVSLYAFVELVSWYERHNLSEYGLSLIHDFCLLQYDLQKYKIKSRKK